MSSSFNNLDDTFINIDDIEEETEGTSRKTSPLWSYVSFSPLGAPVCKRCEFVFSIKSGNSSIERHLSSKHNIIVPKVRKQTTLKFKCTDPWPAKEKLERDEVVVAWVISNQQPFSVVEDKKFIKMMNVFDPRYKVPDRHQIKDMVIQEFDQRRLNIHYDLRRIPGKVSFTADMWTSTLSSEAYLGLTIHYVDENWVLQRFLLDIIPFRTRHTGANMASAIINVLREFNLIGKALALTTDNESAMIVCGQKLSEEFTQALDNDFHFSHYRCSAHILNLAAKQGIEIIDEEVLNVRRLMIKIKNSVLLCDDLRELCSVEKLEYLRPEVDIETRWNSTYYMLCKLQRMETALKMLAIKHDNVRDLMPTTEAWTKIKDTITILEPLERATKNLSGSKYPTIADVRYYFTEIQDHLKYCMEGNENNQYMLADSINQKLEEYWMILDDATTIATILDPRNKLSLFELGEPTTKAINTLREQFTFYCTQESRSQIHPPKENNTSARDYFRQLKKRRLGEPAEVSESTQVASTEIERYLALPCDENMEVLLWWKAHSAEFPVLSQMARDYLAVQSTSVACEQAFSVAGNTITKTRNRLQPETARASLCAKSWIENDIGEKKVA